MSQFLGDPPVEAPNSFCYNPPKRGVKIGAIPVYKTGSGPGSKAAHGEKNVKEDHRGGYLHAFRHEPKGLLLSLP